MNALRAVILCNGSCGRIFAEGLLFENVNEAGFRTESLNECAKASGWVRDGAAHFCPSCQCKRGGGPIIDALAIGAAVDALEIL
jgi:hypothetical protein